MFTSEEISVEKKIVSVFVVLCAIGKCTWLATPKDVASAGKALLCSAYPYLGILNACRRGGPTITSWHVLT